MKNLITILLLAFTISNFAQIKGRITDRSGTPVSFVTVLLDNTNKITTSDEKGNYVLDFKTIGKHTLIFRSVGYKTQKTTVNVDKLPYEHNIVLATEDLTLSEVVIKENPANGIIRAAIKNKKANSEKTSHYKADFYSKVTLIDDVPGSHSKVKIIGGFDGPYHDTIMSGMLYLSETVSKIIYQKPDKLKETIIASKVSGFNNGFSCNTAVQSNFDFYDNTIDLGIAMISPLSKNAFNYYKFKMEGTFIDENNQTINKIKVIAKRDNDPVFDGFIYIVDNSWAIYAVDLNTSGHRTKQASLNTFNLKQNFSYNKNNDAWVKSTQSMDWQTTYHGNKLFGKYTYLYSNYEFTDTFDKKTFTNEIVSFEENSNKKDQSFWKTFRPVPLSEEENKNYTKMDSLAPIRNTKRVLDSIDKKNNKFNFSKALFMEYEYKNSYKKESYLFTGLVTNLGNFPIHFNTVQGWNINTGFSLTHKKENNKGKYSTISSMFDYGYSEERFRITASYFHQFNNRNYANIGISGGSTAVQFNPEEPITKFVNTISSLFFEDNYMKLYNKEFAAIDYGQYVANGLFLNGKLEYSQRKPLYNNTNLVWVKHDDNYTSNNPLFPNDHTTPAFNPHHLTKASLSAKINFGNKYISRPDGRTIITTNKYPTIYLDYYNAFAASDKNYNHQFYSAKVDYEITMGDKGTIATSLRAGKFINGKNITFVDYKHFNGNQTHFNTTPRYLNNFNLMPYYTNSTNDAYFENHTEYYDNGFIMNKIPLLNLLKSNLVLGFHNLAVPNMKPYMEYTIGLNHIGFGEAKRWRVDYVRAYQDGFKVDGVVFGFKF